MQGQQSHGPCLKTQTVPCEGDWQRDFSQNLTSWAVLALDQLPVLLIIMLAAVPSIKQLTSSLQTRQALPVSLDSHALLGCCTLPGSAYAGPVQHNGRICLAQAAIQALVIDSPHRQQRV